MYVTILEDSLNLGRSTIEKLFIYIVDDGDLLITKYICFVLIEDSKYLMHYMIPHIYRHTYSTVNCV